MAPRRMYAMSISPRLSIATRVTSSGTARSTRRLTLVPPVLLEGFHDQLHPGRERQEPVGAGADRRFLEAFVADLFHVLARNDPGGTGRRRRVEGKEVGPRLLELKPDAMRVDDLDLPHPVLQGLGRGAPLALARDLHD